VVFKMFGVYRKITNLIPLGDPMILWTSVSSTTIKQIGYEPSANRMYIRFKRGDMPNTYCNVPEKIYRDFLTSTSKGSYYSQYIKDRYSC
jgi:hypothetical protein